MMPWLFKFARALLFHEPHHLPVTYRSPGADVPVTGHFAPTAVISQLLIAQILKREKN
jgi:hypothetical protein